MISSKRKICQVLALVISGLGASAAMAAGPLVQGGGSTLVQPTINSEIGTFGTTEATFTYYGVGSGAGQNAFLSNAPSFFGSTVTGTVDFANSDAALNTTQISNYTTSPGLGTVDGPLIQAPYIVTPITVPIVNGPSIPSTTTPQTTPNQPHSIALNDDDLCGIFSGAITDWDAVINPETGSAYSSTSLPIQVVYRTDGSGTTELLTRHLAAVCPTSSKTAAGVTFIDTLTFANASVFPTGTLYPHNVPQNFVGASGSGNVRATLTSATTAMVAYLSPDFTNTYLAPSSTVVTPTTATQLAVASLVNAKNSIYYAPTHQNASMALSTAAAPATKLAASNPANWVPNVATPASGYPVSGTSQIILSQCYANSAVATALIDFLTDHYTSYAATVQGNGFDVVPSNFETAISNDFLSNASGWNLNIANATACSGKAGR